MKLLEYKAKELFRNYGIKTMDGIVLDKKEEAAQKIKAAGLDYPVVLKAQVQIGGRGKAGGIQVANNEAQAQAIADKLLFSELKGFEVRELLAEEVAEIRQECYLSIVLDRKSKMPMLIFSAVGGMEIEDVAKASPEKILKVEIDPRIGINHYTARYVLDKTGLNPDLLENMTDTLKKLYEMYCEYHCMLAEINPLIIGDNSELVALDGKVDIDDSALYLHPDIVAFKNKMRFAEHALVTEAADFGFLYIPVNEGGKTAVVSNGSGMLMSCVDMVENADMPVGAAMDLGGGATAERIREAFRILLKTPEINQLFISIFGGITRCDEVAKGIRDGYADAGIPLCIIVRMEGTNREQGVVILESMDAEIEIVNWPDEGVRLLAKRGTGI